MSKRAKLDINGHLRVSVLPSEIKILQENDDVRTDFLCYVQAVGNNDKEVMKYYEHSFHGTKYQSLFSRNVGDY